MGHKRWKHLKMAQSDFKLASCFLFDCFAVLLEADGHKGKQCCSDWSAHPLKLIGIISVNLQDAHLNSSFGLFAC